MSLLHLSHFLVSVRPRPLAFCVVAFLFAALAITAAATLVPDDVEFVIITTAELAPEFEPLATFKSDIGISTRVVTLDWISTQVAPGVDLPEMIRGFLQEAHTQWRTRYVLLGGDLSVVPTRWVFDDFYPAIIGTYIPADLYFAALEGDWDADNDGIFGEPYESAADPGDDADMGPELALGRAPVSTPDEAALFVAKTIAFHSNSASIALPSALLMANVVFPARWPAAGYIILDGATMAERIRTQLEAADPPWFVDRHFHNYLDYPGSVVASAADFLTAVSTGNYRLVHHISYAFGDTIMAGQDFVTGEQLAQLSNPNPFFFTVLSSSGAAFDSNSPIGMALLAPNGGCVAGLGVTRASFPNTVQTYYDVFYRHALETSDARVGDALRSTFNDLIEYASGYVDRWTHLTMVLLGDPTLPLSAVELPVSIEDHGPGSNEDELPTSVLKFGLNAAPNPFNPKLEIRGELPASGQVRLSVCDVRGREVRLLFDGLLAAGETSWQWNGTDGAGRAVASGVYLLRMETVGRIVHRAVTLTR